MRIAHRRGAWCGETARCPHGGVEVRRFTRGDLGAALEGAPGDGGGLGARCIPAGSVRRRLCGAAGLFVLGALKGVGGLAFLLSGKLGGFSGFVGGGWPVGEIVAAVPGQDRAE